MSTGIKVERAVAKLLLQQLKKKLELQEKCDALLRRQKLVDAENGIEAAALKTRILEADISNASISAEHKGSRVRHRLRPCALTRSLPWMNRMFPPAATRPL